MVALLSWHPLPSGIWESGSARPRCAAGGRFGVGAGCGHPWGQGNAHTGWGWPCREGFGDVGGRNAGHELAAVGPMAGGWNQLGFKVPSDPTIP